MQRTSSLVFACLAVFLLATPLVLHKPGWPAGLKSDEPAYYMMAQSLAHEGDLQCELTDIRRLFQEFPYHQVHNLILATDDGWHTVYYGKPYIYSLFAAPWVRLFGGSGLIGFNMAMMLLMIWLGSRYLERFNPPLIALLFSSGFFLLSCSFSYIFWMHPEIFNMASVTLCLYLALADPETSPSRDTRRRLGGWRSWLERPDLRLLASGAALMPSVYNKPMLAAFALPVLYVCWERQKGRPLLKRVFSKPALAWVGGCLLGMGFVVGMAVALTGHPSAYFLNRGGKKVCSPDEMPVGPEPPVLADLLQDVDDAEPLAVQDLTVNGPTPPATASEDSGAEPEAAPAEDGAQPEAKPERPRAAWFWMFRIPRPPLTEVLENLRYFFFGRHTGLFLYFPFSLLALGLFLAHQRRSLRQWSLLAALAVIALFFLLWIPFNWQGGGGFVGNRYYVNAYPGFLFLVGRIAPRLVTLAGFALGGILLGPTVLSPFGRAVPWPTLQAHVRNVPFSNFPLELSLREIPGYDQRIWAGALVRGRNDVFLPRGARFWVHGATTSELWIQSDRPLDRLAFEVSSLGIENSVYLRLEDVDQHVTFEKTEGPVSQRVVLDPSRPSQVRSKQGAKIYVYRLEVTPERGTVRTWDRRFPPQDCFTFAYNEVIQDSFLVGAQMAYLGDAERMERDIYAVDWRGVIPPETAEAGSTFNLPVAVGNASDVAWPADLPTRVALSYRWKKPDGTVVVENGLRTHPEHPIPPGEVFAVEMEVLAPEVPGTYVLELDLVYELVAWFSWKNDGDVERVTVEVEEASEPASESSDPAPKSLGPQSPEAPRRDPGNQIFQIRRDLDSDSAPVFHSPSRRLGRVEVPQAPTTRLSNQPTMQEPTPPRPIICRPLTGPTQQPPTGQQSLHPHWTPSMDPPGANPHFGAEAVAVAVGEARAGVDEDRRRVDALEKRIGDGDVLGDDGLGVAAAVLVDVLDGFIEAGDGGDGEHEVAVLGAPVGVGRRVDVLADAVAGHQVGQAAGVGP